MGLACVNPPCINGKIDPWKKKFMLDLLIQKRPGCQLLCGNVMEHVLCAVSLKCSEEDSGNFQGLYLLYCILYFPYTSESCQSSCNDSFYVASIYFTFCTQEVAWLLLLRLSLCFRPLCLPSKSFYVSDVSCNSLISRTIC